MTIADNVLDALPLEPGVYLFRDGDGVVIYVGKAKSLRARVRQYFRGQDERYVVAAGYLPRAAVTVETIVVADEKAALLLENSLIKQHRPRFNVKLRDDKQYLVLRLAVPSKRAVSNVETNDAATAALPRKDELVGLFPRVEVVRNIRNDGARYFGPYHSATSARHTLKLLNRHFQLRTCTDSVLQSRGRTCLQYQINRCPGPCAVAVDPVAYGEQVDDVVMFLQGRDQDLVSRLRNRMAKHAEAEQFEQAGALRDSIAAVERTLTKQHVVQDDFVDQDVWGIARHADIAEVVVMFIRHGKLVGQRQFSQKDQELPDAEVVRGCIGQYYQMEEGTLVPSEILTPEPLEDAELLSEWLSSKAAQKVKLVAPQRGTKVRLIEMAQQNAAALLNSRKQRMPTGADVLPKLKERLRLVNFPERIECFDIAHTQGTGTVASMVTFIDGVPDKSLYRKFTIKSVTNNDFEAMREVISRRLARAETSRVTNASKGGATEKTADADAWRLPDLLVIDGGKGQLGMAVAAMEELGIGVGNAAAGSSVGLSEEESLEASIAPQERRVVDIVSLAKERDLQGGTAPDRVYLHGAKDAIELRRNTAELYLLARLRDEAHRFANSFHRQTRSKAMLSSELDGIAGVGATRRKALLVKFGSVRGIAQASVNEIAAVSGIGEALATKILAALK